MNDTSNQQQADMHLPQPVVSNTPPSSAPDTPLPPQPPLAVQQPMSQAGAVQSRTMPQAQNRDIIEPEWVHAVERLMRQKIDDPRLLAAELASLKAQYVQKRYGKEIKAPSGARQA